MTPTTMKRIAADLGVSITTVSKVLNNHADIGATTRARVLARVEELGYRPNAVARSLSLRRTNTLGVVTPLSDPLRWPRLHIGDWPPDELEQALARVLQAAA